MCKFKAQFPRIVCAKLKICNCNFLYSTSILIQNAKPLNTILMDVVPCANMKFLPWPQCVNSPEGDASRQFDHSCVPGEIFILITILFMNKPSAEVPCISRIDIIQSLYIKV